MDKNPSSITYTSKFNINGIRLYVKLLWKPNENDLFNVILYDGDCSWSGRFSKAFAKQNWIRLRETEELYCSNVHRAMKSCDVDFAYDFSTTPGDEDCATFSWKKRLGDKFLVHGIVPVHRDVFLESKNSPLDLLLLENTDLRQTARVYENKTEGLSADFEKCKSEIEKFINIRTSLEETMYEKFLQLLNGKKKRVSLLEEDLEKLETK